MIPPCARRPDAGVSVCCLLCERYLGRRRGVFDLDDDTFFTTCVCDFISRTYGF